MSLFVLILPSCQMDDKSSGFSSRVVNTAVSLQLHLAQACSLSALQSCSLTSVGNVLNRSSSTTRPLLFKRRHSPSSTGRHSSRFPLSSSWVSPVSSPKRDGSVCKQLFPRFRVWSFLHWNSSGGKASIWNREHQKQNNEECVSKQGWQIRTSLDSKTKLKFALNKAHLWCVLIQFIIQSKCY